MIQTYCKECKKTSQTLTDTGFCPWCSHDTRKINRKMIYKAAVFGIIFAAIMLILAYPTLSKAAEITKGTIDGKYVYLKTTKGPADTKITTGYVDGKYTRLKTRKSVTGTITSGYVAGKYTRIKSSKFD